MGENLDIRISAKFIQKDSNPFLHLTHLDSGDGFTEEQIRDYNNYIKDFNSDIPSIKDISHLGIPNVAKRMRLVYGDKSHIEFANEPGYGARIDLFIPYNSLD